MSEYKRGDYVVQVDGKDVYTARQSFESERRTMCIIDRCEAMAATALVFSIIALIAALAG